jgi:hypothetical protein
MNTNLLKKTLLAIETHLTSRAMNSEAHPFVLAMFRHASTPDAQIALIEHLVAQQVMVDPREPLKAFTVVSSSSHRVSYLVIGTSKKSLGERYGFTATEVRKANELNGFSPAAALALSEKSDPLARWRKEGTFGEWQRA